MASENDNAKYMRRPLFVFLWGGGGGGVCLEREGGPFL